MRWGAVRDILIRRGASSIKSRMAELQAAASLPGRMVAGQAVVDYFLRGGFIADQDGQAGGLRFHDRLAHRVDARGEGEQVAAGVEGSQGVVIILGRRENGQEGR